MPEPNSVAIISKVQHAIVATQTSDSLVIRKVDLTLKNLDQKVVGVGWEGAILAFSAISFLWEGECEYDREQTNTLTLTLGGAS